MFNIFLTILSVAGIFCTLIGMLTVFYWFKTPPQPNDSSNRINNIQSWWVGLTRPNVLGEAYNKHFSKDVMEQIEGKQDE